jgi:phosphoribosylanthranilate isomerase
VGVFVDPSPEFVREVITQTGLNTLQFHGHETPEFCAQFGLKTIKAFRLRDRSTLAELPAHRGSAWLLDSYVAGVPGGSGRTFNWDLAIEAKRLGNPVFLAGGLTPENVAEAVRHVAPFGVDVSSGVEATPGRKDPARLQQFIARARAAAADLA